jgi:hypothetical protein
LLYAIRSRRPLRAGGTFGAALDAAFEVERGFDMSAQLLLSWR